MKLIQDIYVYGIGCYIYLLRSFTKYDRMVRPLSDNFGEKYFQALDKGGVLP